jgi:anti-sigma-K factor RskA
MTHQETEQLLALDAVDALTSDEAAALALHLAACPDCRQAADGWHESGAMLALALDPVAPPPAVRAAVLRAVAPSAPEEAADDEESFFDRRWWAVAACLFLALWGWREVSVRSIRERVKTEEVVSQHLAEQNRLLEEKNQKMLAQMQALAAPDTRTIALAGQQIAPSASAKVFMEPSKRRAMVFFYNMPANAGDKSYQLWIIRGDQAKPQSAGTFDVHNPEGQSSIVIENLPVATEIKGLAVTLEPKGGVPAPTNTDFFVSGQTS